MWTLTTDNLPPENVKILGYYPNPDAIGGSSYIDILTRDEDDWFDQEGWGVDAPTHWMTMPELPTS